MLEKKRDKETKAGYALLPLLCYNRKKPPQQLPLFFIMTTLDKEIRTRVAPEIKNAFSDIAKEKGLTESEFLRLLINNAISTNGGEEIKMINELKLNEKDTDLERITIRMPSFIMEAAKERAKTQGMATSRWVKSLVQSNLIKLPVLTDKEIYAIRESNRELSAVGNNLNQIARKLNESPFETDLVKIEKIDEIKRDIFLLKSELTKLVMVSWDNWTAFNNLTVFK